MELDKAKCARLSGQMDSVAQRLDAMPRIAAAARFELLPVGFDPEPWLTLRGELLAMLTHLRTIHSEILEDPLVGPESMAAVSLPLLDDTMGCFLATAAAVQSCIKDAPRPEESSTAQEALGKLRVRMLSMHTGPERSVLASISISQRAAQMSIMAAVAMTVEISVAVVRSALVTIHAPAKPFSLSVLMRTLLSLVMAPPVALARVYLRLMRAIYHGVLNIHGEVIPRATLVDLAKYLVGSMLVSFFMFVPAYRKFMVQYEAWWVAITFVFVAGVRLEDSMRKSMLRVIGTLVGCIVAFVGLVVYVHSKSSHGRIAFLLIYRLAIYFVLPLLTTRFIGGISAIWLVMSTMDGLLLCKLGLTDHKAIVAVASRIVSTCIGALVSFLISFLIFPHTVRERVCLDVSGALSAARLGAVELVLGFGKSPLPEIAIRWDNVSSVRVLARKLIGRVQGITNDVNIWGAAGLKHNPECASMRRLTAATLRVILSVESLALYLKRESPYKGDKMLHDLLVRANRGDLVAYIDSGYSSEPRDIYLAPLSPLLSEVAASLAEGLEFLSSAVAGDYRPIESLGPHAASSKMVSIEMRSFDRFMAEYSRLRTLRYASLDSQGPPLLKIDDYIRFAAFIHSLERLVRATAKLRAEIEDFCKYERPQARESIHDTFLVF